MGNGLTSRLALLALSLGMAAIAVEAALRTYSVLVETDLARALQVDLYDPLIEPYGEVGYRPRPNGTIRYPNETSAHTNDLGFRGPVVASGRAEGILRILLLGGSTTFGWGVNDDETIDAHMRELLAERHPTLSFEVVNLAFDGYDSYQLLERYRQDGRKLEPDVVIIHEGVNDVRNAWHRDIKPGDPRTLLYRARMEQLRSEQAAGKPSLWTVLEHYSYLVRLGGWLRQEFLSTVAEGGRGPGTPPTFYWDALDYFEGNFDAIVELVRAQATPAVVLLSNPPSSLRVLYPPNHPPRADYWIVDAATTQIYRDSLRSRTMTLAASKAAQGSAVAYVPHKDLPGGLFLDDAHLTPAGNRRVAEAFVAALEPWLDDLAP